jgi:hypothetical protein
MFVVCLATERQRPHRLVRPRTSPFHGGNGGSNPPGDATSLLSGPDIGLSVPLVLQKIPPNSWQGFRTGKTLSDPSIWYPANTLGGYCFLVAGIFELAAWLFIVSAPSLPLTEFLRGGLCSS